MPSEIADVVDLALAVAAAFDRSGIPYFLGGSLASSLQGEPRATNGIDFVIEMDEARIGLLSAELGRDFDVDETGRAEVEVRPGKALYLKSPEDSVLRKLRWYVDGGRVSARQLRDVVEILRVNAGRVDEGYLDQWAEPLAVADELRRARDQAAA